MLEKIASVATIIAFVIYLFIEWPKIQRRWKESYRWFELFLMVVFVFIAIMGLALMILSLFIRGPVFLLNLSAAFTLLGLSQLMGYWFQNKTLLYRRSANIPRFIWLYFVAMFLVGTIGVLHFGFGLL